MRWRSATCSKPSSPASCAPSPSPRAPRRRPTPSRRRSSRPTGGAVEGFLSLGGGPSPPPITYREVANSLRRLRELMDEVLAASPELEAQGTEVVSVGADDVRNRLHVGLLRLDDEAERRVLEAVGATPDEVSFEQGDVTPAL